MEEEKYMRRCIELAKNGLCNVPPNPMVGAVIVCNGRIIGEGYHIRCGEAHAEVNAIRSVKAESLLKHSTIYVSLEPCSHYGKNTSMTFEEAVSLADRIKEQVIGVPVKGRLIESLFIGPTNWNEMHVFMNICLQKGEDEAIDEFIGKSFSVYGRSVTYINPDLPRWDVIVLDDWEKTIYN